MPGLWVYFWFCRGTYLLKIWANCLPRCILSNRVGEHIFFLGLIEHFKRLYTIFASLWTELYNQVYENNSHNQEQTSDTQVYEQNLYDPIKITNTCKKGTCIFPFLSVGLITENTLNSGTFQSHLENSYVEILYCKEYPCLPRHFAGYRACKGIINLIIEA